MKDQKNAIQSQKKKREVAENVMLKEGEFGNLNSRKLSKSQLDLAEAVSQVSLKTEHLQDSLNRFEDRKSKDLRVL